MEKFQRDHCNRKEHLDRRIPKGKSPKGRFKEISQWENSKGKTPIKEFQRESFKAKVRMGRFQRDKYDTRKKADPLLNV